MNCDCEVIIPKTSSELFQDNNSVWKGGVLGSLIEAAICPNPTTHGEEEKCSRYYQMLIQYCSRLDERARATAAAPACRSGRCAQERVEWSVPHCHAPLPSSIHPHISSARCPMDGRTRTAKKTRRVRPRDRRAAASMSFEFEIRMILILTNAATL